MWWMVSESKLFWYLVVFHLTTITIPTGIDYYPMLLSMCDYNPFLWRDEYVVSNRFSCSYV